MEIYIAGAGAGKTTTMAEHIIKLREKIEKYKIIFCITFTNNAVDCIKGKLTEHYGEIPSNIMVSTIHSFLYQQLVRPYYYLLYGKQFQRISVADLPTDAKYKKGKISRLEKRDILHQTAIPERAMWVIYQKTGDRKGIKDKRKVIKDIFSEYCGAVCIDEAQDIDSKMQVIIEVLHEMGIGLLLMGDPKQDLKGHKCLRSLIKKYEKEVKYINVCHRCPQEHLELSNSIVAISEQQHSKKSGGVIKIQFETDISYKKLIQDKQYDLTYISKKQGIYNTHKEKGKQSNVLAVAEEMEAIVRKKYSDKSEMDVKREAYYYSEKLIDLYVDTGNRERALYKLSKEVVIDKREYGILINMLLDKDEEINDERVVVSSIESIKGREGKNCLFILTTDLAAYLFGDKTEDNATKNQLYVALTRSLDKLTIFITDKVENKYGREKIEDFFSRYLPKNIFYDA